MKISQNSLKTDTDDIKIREYIRQKNKAERDYESRLKNERRQARAEGRAEGLEEGIGIGRVEERREIIAQLKSGGMTDEEIAGLIGS